MSEDFTGEIPSTPDGEVEERQVGEPQEDVQSSEEKGQLQSLQAERRKRQEAERELEESRRAAQFYKDYALQSSQPQAQGELGYDPDDVPSFSDVDRLVNERVNRLAQGQRAKDIDRMEAEARRTYPDFEEAFLLAVDMAKAQPGLGEAIMNSKNPAETAYLLGKTHPDYMLQSKKKTAKEVAEKIDSNLNAQKTLTNIANGGSPVPKKDWAKATDEEILQRAQSVIMGR